MTKSEKMLIKSNENIKNIELEFKMIVSNIKIKSTLLVNQRKNNIINKQLLLYFLKIKLVQ